MQIATLDQFKTQFPKATVSDVDTYDSDSIQIYFDEDEVTVHPAIVKMKTVAPKDVNIQCDWTDDHTFCCILGIEFPEDSNTYLVRFMWFDPTVLLQMGKSINNQEQSAKLVQQLFID